RAPRHPQPFPTRRSSDLVDHVFDEDAAAAMGLEKDMICVMIHSGSRGLGYQVCDDALAHLRKAPEKYGIELPDRQLACAPVQSPDRKSTRLNSSHRTNSY